MIFSSVMPEPRSWMFAMLGWLELGMKENKGEICKFFVSGQIIEPHNLI